MVKTATSQNGDTETATEMAILKTATNPNNTYSEAYIIDRRLYTSRVAHLNWPVTLTLTLTVVTVQFICATSDLVLIQQNKFY